MITEKDIYKLAKLARLTVDASEAASLSRELSSIISYAEKLGELDLSGVNATAHAISVSNVFRESGDTPRDAKIIDAAIQSAPSGDIPKRLFKVPKVIGSS